MSIRYQPTPVSSRLPDMMSSTAVAGTLYRVAAFTDNHVGGNPAGVWVGDVLPAPERMQAIARTVGFSETVFVSPMQGTRRTVRYFSPEVEIPFCGHATIAAGVILGERSGNQRYLFSTTVGEVPVDVRGDARQRVASLTSVEPAHVSVADELLDEVLTALRWRRQDLNPAIPPVRAFAGAWHLVLAVATPERLADLAYDFDALKAVMSQAGLTTLQLIWRDGDGVIHARNPFPIGGVVEDPATGAAAAALGGYLRDAALIAVPATLTIRQGETMGRPSVLIVDIPTAGGIVVTGSAIEMEPAELAVE